MNAKKLMVVFALSLMIPAPVGAQIVIERYNEDVDPVRPPKKEAETSSEAPQEVEAEDDTELSDSDREEIKEVLVKELRKVSTACVTKGKIFRSDRAELQGRSSWTIDEEGTATPDGEFEFTTETKDAFFVTDKMMKQMPADRTDMVVKGAVASFAACVGAMTAKTGVTGKTGTVSMSYKVTFVSKKAKIVVD